LSRTVLTEAAAMEAAAGKAMVAVVSILSPPQPVGM